MAQPLTKKALPDHEEMVARVLAVYDGATKEDVLQGTVWYEDAEEVARDIAAGTSFSVEQIAGVLSAVSPRMPWGRNKTVAREIVRRYKAGAHGDFSGLGIGANIRLAVKILQGASPESVLKNKRLAFYRNIAGDPNAVTVDVWGTRIVAGPDYDSPGNCYDAVVNAYAEAAEVVQLPARIMQAVVWVTYRRNALTQKHLSWLNRDQPKVYA